jgi:hypothetical protein
MRDYLLSAAMVFAASSVSAASIDMFQSSAGTAFFMGNTETRETVFDVNSAITLSALGAEIDPTGDISFRWNIFTSDAGATEISQVFTTDFSVTDIGMSVYDTSVNIALGIGTYILQLENLGTSSVMQRYNEAAETLPFDIASGAITVRDGSANTSVNSILPAFSISVGDTPPVVPLPASAWLLLGGLAGMRRLREKS